MKNIILIFALAVTALHCGRNTDDTSNSDVLSPASQTGANSFGVKINGVVYTPKSSTNDLSNIGYPQYNGVWINDNNQGDTFVPIIHLSKVNTTQMILRINDTQGITTKEYVLNGQDEYSPVGRITIDYLLSEGTSLKKQYNAVANSGSIVITKNDTNIISGVFSGKVKNISDPTDILDITDGRFDFNKNTINNYRFP